EKSVVRTGFSFPVEYATFRLKVPSIVSPLEEIDSTCPASTFCRKYGLNGTFTRGCDDCDIATERRLMASMTATKIQNQRSRCGGGGLCSSGVPRPSGAGATRQRPLSCGICSGGTPSILYLCAAPAHRSFTQPLSASADWGSTCSRLRSEASDLRDP